MRSRWVPVLGWVECALAFVFLLVSAVGLVYDNAEVEEANIFPFASRFKYQTALYQLVLLAVLAGVSRAAARLEEAGLVRKEDHDKDRRLVALVEGLTPPA